MPLRTLIDPPARNRRPDSHDPLVFDPTNKGRMEPSKTR